MSLQSIITDLKNTISDKLSNGEQPTKPEKKTIKKPVTEDSDSDEEPDPAPVAKKRKPASAPEIPFWGENPNVLTDFKYILEFFPTESMTYEQKLNAVTRTILGLTVIGFVISQSARLVFISIVTVFAIFLMQYFNKKQKIKTDFSKQLDGVTEGFENPANSVLNEKHLSSNPALFVSPSSHNPLSNVLISDYAFNPHRKPAPPAFNTNVNEDILTQAKNMISEINHDQPDITDKLFKDLGEEMEFEQSMRQFHSNPSTTIPNDQGAFAEFCYGSMISCKEGNMFACARNKTNYTNY